MSKKQYLLAISSLAISISSSSLAISISSATGALESPAELLFAAATAGDLEQARSILRQNPEAAKATDERKSTPLHWATARGFPAVAQLLIEHNADIEAVDRHEATPNSFGRSIPSQGFSAHREHNWMLLQQIAIHHSIKQSVPIILPLFAFWQSFHPKLSMHKQCMATRHSISQQALTRLKA